MNEPVDVQLDTAIELQNKKSYQQAITIFDGICQQLDTPENFVKIATLEKSVCLHALKQWQAAIEGLAHIDGNVQEAAKYYFCRGDCKKQISDLSGAKLDFYTALWGDPLNDKYLKAYASIMSDNEAGLLAGLRQIADLKVDKAIKIRAFLAKKSFKKETQRVSGFVELLDASAVYIKDFHALYALADALRAAGEFQSAFLMMKRIMALPRTGTPLPIAWSYKYSDISYQALGYFEYPNVNKYYNFKYDKKIEDADTLIVIFSSVVNKFIVRSYDFYTDILFVSERQMNFYTYNFDGLCDYIGNLIDRHGYKKVKLLGSSKGSFAAINIGLKISSVLKSVEFAVAAFSPQTQLFPFNENINNLPSYVGLKKRCTEFLVLDFSVKKFGGLADKFEKIDSNLSIHILYGALHRRDKAEARKLSNMKRVFFHPVENFPLHTTIALYIKKGEALAKALQNTVLTGGGDDAFFADQDQDLDMEKFLKEEYYQKMDLNIFLKSI